MSNAGIADQQGFGGGGQRAGQGGGDDRGDAGRLVRFLKALDADLQAMLAEPGFLQSDLRTLAIRAYEAGATPQIAELIRLLTEEWSRYADSLAHHGLTGVQLDFKLKVHGQARDLYLTPPPPDSVRFRIEDDGRLTGITSDAWADAAAKDYLDCSDIILESLSGALGGAGAALIEIKKMIEWLKGAGARWARRLFFR